VVGGYCWVRALTQSLTVMSTSVNKVNIRILVNKILLVL